MDFVKILASLGGVKPCRDCAKTGTKAVLCSSDEPVEVCPSCHGTGTVLDLAPLLAKPKMLEECAVALRKEVLSGGHASFVELHDEVYVVGPQRAGNLVFKVAEQLGGTAVVAIPEYKIGQGDGYECHGEWHDSPAIVANGYRLSLPIPDGATVLFVMDRSDEQEIRDISRASGVSVTKVLPYLLSLVHYGHPEQIFTAECTCGSGFGSVSLRIISLYQEKA